MKNSGILARLFGRSHSPLVSQIFSQAIGRPLLVHPQMGEAVLGAYLNGAIEDRPSTLVFRDIEPGTPAQNGLPETPARRIAVINVSGPLVNRYEEGFCEPGPLSYEALRVAFERALTDASIEAIVLRIESPGGMAAGCFDFSDHVFNNRGVKPIHAVVDDYAYSAAFAIACAADTIWVTRTGGAGSVGTRAFHVDQSGWNTKNGLKITEIFAGAHKNDFTPHSPLADEVRERLQQELEEHRAEFAATVARYRGLEVAAVLATEALTYNGQAAIDIGFADRLGTFHDAVAFLRDGEEENQQADPTAPAGSGAATAAADTTDAEDSSEPATGGDAATGAGEVAQAQGPEPAAEDTASATASQLSEEQARKIDRAGVIDAISAADLVAELTAALIKRSDITPGTVEAAIEHARKVDDLCAAAGLRSCAADYVANNTSLTNVRSQLADAVADAGPEIVTTLPALGAVKTDGGNKLSPQTIYQKRGN